MKLKENLLALLLATGWIGLSEFVRNELFLKYLWENHYQSLGLVFPDEIVNAAVWGLWSLCLAVLIFIVRKKFSLFQTTFIVWFAGFVLMWIVIGNMNVLPFEILWYAVPLSLLEVFVAVFIIKKLSFSVKNEK